ncbi:hypothetical protein [Streptomyces sp. NPDC058157]|uniref:hypothetical protein n=1 Tax=Streptomyces sp. NPDC058157 TaxID=3346360 RepID=UPI0036E721A1
MAECRSPEAFAGRRVVVVGAGDSAVQAASELARTSRTTLATRARPRAAGCCAPRPPSPSWTAAATAPRSPRACPTAGRYSPPWTATRSLGRTGRWSEWTR